MRIKLCQHVLSGLQGVAQKEPVKIHCSVQNYTNIARVLQANGAAYTIGTASAAVPLAGAAFTFHEEFRFEAVVLGMLLL